MHLFCNMSGSDSETEQSSSVSPLRLLVQLAVIITPQCLCSALCVKTPGAKILRTGFHSFDFCGVVVTQKVAQLWEGAVE